MQAPEFRAWAKKFVMVRLETMRRTDEARRNLAILRERYRHGGVPLYVFLTPEGREVERLPKSGEPSLAEFLEAFQKTWEASAGR